MIEQNISIDQILELYKNGFFPMSKSKESKEINYYKPNVRFVIPINNFHIPKKLFNEFKKKKFKFSIDKSFLSVINNCSKPRKLKKETWINDIIINTYFDLFKKGYCKSIECFDEEKLVGGLYGVHIGSCFFGESMFSTIDNASKHCLLYLVSILKNYNFSLLDSQFFNPHLKQFGAYEITDYEYQLILKKGINEKSIFPKSFNFQKSISILQSLSHKS